MEEGIVARANMKKVVVVKVSVFTITYATMLDLKHFVLAIFLLCLRDSCFCHDDDDLGLTKLGEMKI